VPRDAPSLESSCYGLYRRAPPTPGPLTSMPSFGSEPSLLPVSGLEPPVLPQPFPRFPAFPLPLPRPEPPWPPSRHCRRCRCHRYSDYRRGRPWLCRWCRARANACVVKARAGPRLIGP
jgi:hypothetical protein